MGVCYFVRYCVTRSALIWVVQICVRTELQADNIEWLCCCDPTVCLPPFDLHCSWLQTVTAPIIQWQMFCNHYQQSICSFIEQCDLWGHFLNTLASILFISNKGVEFHNWVETKYTFYFSDCLEFISPCFLPLPLLYSNLTFIYS